MARQSSSPMIYKAGDIVMPAEIRDYRDIKRKAKYQEMHPFLAVIRVRDVTSEYGRGIVSHPQMLRVRIERGDRRKHRTTWVSGNSVSFLPDIKKMMEDGTLFTWAYKDDEPRPIHIRPG